MSAAPTSTEPSKKGRRANPYNTTNQPTNQPTNQLTTHDSKIPNRRHQPSGGAAGAATDIEIQAREIRKLKDVLNGLYAAHTGRAAERIEALLERDFHLSAREAREFGLVDEVVAARPPAAAAGGGGGAGAPA